MADVTLPSLNDLQAIRPLPADVMAVFISGSVVTGWAHAKSDIDVYVITAEPFAGDVEVFEFAAVEPARIPVGVAVADGWRFDFEYWSDGQIEQVLAKCASTDYEDQPSLPLAEHDVDLLHRLQRGVAISGHEWLARRQRQLAESGAEIIIARQLLRGADGLLEDAIGMLTNEDFESAVLAARDAFGCVVDALLARSGQLSPRSKWRARKLRDAASDVLPWSRYWEFETMATFDPGAPERWVRSLVLTCRDVMMRIEV